MPEHHDEPLKANIAMQHCMMAGIARVSQRRPESCKQIEEPPKRAN
jgi:hypothetical protein